MTNPARKLSRVGVKLTDAAIKRLMGFRYIREAISGALGRVSPKDVHVPKGGRFVSFRLEDPATFHPALFATMRVGARGTLLTIGTPKAAIRDRARFRRHLALMGWDERRGKWTRPLSDGQRRSMVYQLRAAGVLGGSRTQRVLVPIPRVEAIVRQFISRPEIRRAVAMNPFASVGSMIPGDIYASRWHQSRSPAAKHASAMRRGGMKAGVASLKNAAVRRVARVLDAGEKEQVRVLQEERTKVAAMLTKPMAARVFQSLMKELERLNRAISDLKYGVFGHQNRRGRSARSNPILATLGFNPAISVGDTVKYSVKWLRSTGTYTGPLPRARGVVTALEPLGPGTILAVVDWNFPDVPKRVNVANLVPAGKREADNPRHRTARRNPILATLGFNPGKRVMTLAESAKLKGCPPGMVRSRAGKCVPRAERNPAAYIVRDTFRGVDLASGLSAERAHKYVAKIAHRFPAGALSVVAEHSRFNRGARRNDGGTVSIDVPFRDKQKVTPAQMRSWLTSLPSSPVRNLLVQRFNQSMKQYRKFHLGAEPKFFTYQPVPLGSQKRITDVDFVVSEGKEWAAPYQVPTHSGKYDPGVEGRYIHAHGESGIEIPTIKRPAHPSRLPERFHTADGKFAGVLIGQSPVKIGKWYEH